MKNLYKIAAKSCQNVYQDNTDLGTIEFKLGVAKFKNKIIQVLAIAGTNELGDWWANINLWSKKGIKKGAYDAAVKIHEQIQHKIKYPLLVCGHSKAGATAIAYKRLFTSSWCVAFAPARSLRYWSDRKMQNTTIFIDPDDPVSKAGFISFGHPDCKIIEAKDDHAGLHVADHFMKNWICFVEGLAQV